MWQSHVGNAPSQGSLSGVRVVCGNFFVKVLNSSPEENQANNKGSQLSIPTGATVAKKCYFAPLVHVQYLSSAVFVVIYSGKHRENSATLKCFLQQMCIKC